MNVAHEMNEVLIPPSFLFHLSVPCRQSATKWQPKGISLGPEYAIPSFHAELNQGPQFADFRLAWNNDGLLVHLRTTGKKQSPWCRDSRLEDSDGLSLLIDTRDTHNIHRASRFCHHFVLLPQGGGRMLNEPVIRLKDINRARENPRAAPAESLQVRSEKRIDGYVLQAMIRAEALTGFDPVEHPRLGFSFAIVDREQGWQTFNLGPEFPFLSDPSLWGTLELISAEN